MDAKGEPDTKKTWSTDRRPQDEPINQPINQPLLVSRESAGRQLRVAEADSWSRGQFGNSEERERPFLGDLPSSSVNNVTEDTNFCVWQWSIKYSYDLCVKVINKSDY
jgi:hypothetical protein